jgi:hypothetical protein
MEVRALLERPGQPIEEVSFTPDGSDLTLAGTFDRVRLVVVNRRAQDPATPTVPVLYSASWQSESAGTLVSVQYDDGNPSRDYYTTGGSVVLMTRFTVPEPDRATLDAVSLSPFYDNQFGNSEVPSTAPRDLKLFVVDVTAGAPDLSKEIFSLVVTDPRSYAPSLTGDSASEITCRILRWRLSAL